MNSNAAARKRRAPPEVNTPLPSQQQNRQMTPNAGVSANQNALTLPQVINVIDKRIIALETFVKETQANPLSSNNGSGTTETPASSIDSAMLQNIIQEFSARFDILAEEIGNLKDTILKLQTYTMDVNKMLVDERIHIFSDLDNKRLSFNDNVANVVNDTVNDSVKENIKLEEMLVSTFELADEINNVNN